MDFVCGESAHHSRRSISLFHRYRQIWILVALIGVVAHSSLVAAQETSTAKPPTAKTEQDGKVQISFEGARWREVIKWIADEGELALHLGDLPTGSFTYSDPSWFTHQQAIDRINLFLLPQGFTLVRSGRLLSVINLADPRSMQQLEAIARLVSIDKLADLENHDVVKCFFKLGELKAQNAVEELSALKLMTAPAVFTKTNQLLITDTAGKLKNVKAILEAFQPSMLANGTVVKSFALEHVDAEDILVVARPHLGLATGEMIGIDVSLSADLTGRNIFVTGIEDKVKLIEGLILAIDKPKKTLASGKTELRSHVVEGGNVDLVYSVLQTLLAGKSIRLSMDESASSIVALATPEVQAEIAQTVSQLQSADADFEVIPLKNVDPHFAISLLTEMLDLPGAFDDPDDIDPNAPKIDADPRNMRLFVRAKKHQIEQIKKIVAGLDVSSGGSNDKIRMFPLRGKQAEQVLETAAKFWREKNPIILYRSVVPTNTESTERVLTGVSRKTRPIILAKSESDTPNMRWLTDNRDSQEPAIHCQLTPRGLLMQSDDIAALDQFEKHLRAIVGPGLSMPSPPIVFYLKYTKPDDAVRMLAELLDGGESVQDSVGSLVNGYVDSPGTFFGSIVTSRDGTTTMIGGTMTVVADSRLNRLIAQGTASDIDRIENYLKIIDKDTSITSNETYGTSHVIELLNVRASEVAAVIRDAYAGRVSGGTTSGGSTGSRQPNQPRSAQKGRSEAPAKTSNPKQNQQSESKKPTSKAAANKGGGKTARNLEPMMTIAVHEPSNSLVVTAPEQLFKEVEQLAKLIDSRSKQFVEIVPTTNGVALERMLLRAFSGRATSSGNSSRTSSGSIAPRSPSPSQKPASRPNSSPVRNKSGR